MLAAQWLFDSHCGSDELLRFVQTMIVMEILLGDKAATDIVGLSELMSNRCAYLIAKNHSERNELLKEFRSIYKVRSEIVHAGKTRLNAEERRLFLRLQFLCARTMAEEMQLL
jgi:hypothetical protein